MKVEKAERERSDKIVETRMHTIACEAVCCCPELEAPHANGSKQHNEVKMKMKMKTMAEGEMSEKIRSFGHDRGGRHD